MRLLTHRPGCTDSRYATDPFCERCRERREQERGELLSRSVAGLERLLRDPFTSERRRVEIRALLRARR